MSRGTSRDGRGRKAATSFAQVRQDVFPYRPIPLVARHHYRSGGLARRSDRRPGAADGPQRGTIAHYGGHALAAPVSGRRLSGIRSHSDMSVRRPDGIGMIVTVLAGCTAPAVVGPDRRAGLRQERQRDEAGQDRTAGHRRGRRYDDGEGRSCGPPCRCPATRPTRRSAPPSRAWHRGEAGRRSRWPAGAAGAHPEGRDTGARKRRKEHPGHAALIGLDAPASGVRPRRGQPAYGG
ncbi:MAG: M50 family metallopeptidase [Actinomycetes bacterium]